MPTKFKNFDKLKIAMTSFQRNNQAYVQDVLQTLANELITYIREYVPVDTGKYRDSWQVLTQDSFSITVGLPNDPQLRIIYNIKEFTGITVPFILPKNKKALHWVDPFTGDDVFVKYVAVDSPLQKNPQPHFRPAIQRLKRNMKGILFVKVREHFPTVSWTDRTELSGNFKRESAETI